MIKTDRLIPEVYYRESRDFQVLGRVFDMIANYNKTNIDLMLADPLDAKANSKLLQLVASTIGFTSKHIYDNADLVAICKTFNTLVKGKGTLTALNDAVKVLLNRQGIIITYDDIVRLEKDSLGNLTYNLIIYVPVQMKDTILLEDLFEYLLPAGWTYRFVSVIGDTKDIHTIDLGVETKVTIKSRDSKDPQVAKLDENSEMEEGSETYQSVVAGRGN